MICAGLLWISIQMFNMLRLRALVSTKTAAYSQTAGFTLLLTVQLTKIATKIPAPNHLRILCKAELPEENPLGTRPLKSLKHPKGAPVGSPENHFIIELDLIH